MKKSIVFALIAVLLLGCNSSNERVLTTATGSIYECLVVSERELESTLTETMGADMYGLPQMEAVMTVTHIAPPHLMRSIWRPVISCWWILTAPDTHT